MRKPLAMRALGGMAIFALGVASTLVAQPLTDSSPRVEKHRADLSGAPDMEVIVSTGEYAPGDTIPLHSHHGLEALYVVDAATIQAPDRPPKELPAGTTILNLRDVDHAGFQVVGDKSLKLVTVHVVDKNKPLYVWSSAAGELTGE